jgi:hypothetical protein
MLPIFNPAIIQDYNIEGNENVESEDFDMGFGCVPVVVEKEMQPPPPVHCNLTMEEIKQEKYYQKWLKNYL